MHDDRPLDPEGFGTPSPHSIWVRIGWDDGKAVYVDSAWWFDRKDPTPHCFPNYKRRLIVGKVVYFPCSEMLATIVQVSLARGAYVGFALTRSHSLSITVMTGKDKAKFYIERAEDEEYVSEDILEFLQGDEKA